MRHISAKCMLCIMRVNSFKHCTIHFTINPWGKRINNLIPSLLELHYCFQLILSIFYNFIKFSISAFFYSFSFQPLSQGKHLEECKIYEFDGTSYGTILFQLISLLSSQIPNNALSMREQQTLKGKAGQRFCKRAFVWERSTTYVD